MHTIEVDQGYILTPHESTPLYLSVQTVPTVEADVSIFCTNAEFTLDDDRYFVFFNQLTSPQSEVRLLPDLAGDRHQFGLSLSKLPASVHHLTVVLTSEHPLSHLQAIHLNLHGPDRQPFAAVHLPITGEGQSVLLGEIGRTTDSWQLRPAGTVLSSDLNTLFSDAQAGRLPRPLPPVDALPGPLGAPMPQETAPEELPTPPVTTVIRPQAVPTPSQIEPRLTLPVGKLTAQDAEVSARLMEVAGRIPNVLPQLQTEEATKHTLVMPFIQALGYDVFNPSEVTPELNADVGIKKGEKVDYAILQNGKPIILIECKHHNVLPSLEHASQLYRYFSVTEARFAILTNGTAYRFYTDLEKPNTMDSRPFLEVDLLQLKDTDIGELLKFAKHTFDQDNILSLASEMKYIRAIKQHLTQEFAEPSDDLIRLLSGRVFEGRLTTAVRNRFALYTKKALNEFLAQIISDRLRDAFTAAEPNAAGSSEPDELDSDETGLITSPEEWQAFYMVRSILREEVNYARIHLRKHQSYSTVLLDNNRRRTICRFYFTEKRLQLGVFHKPDRQEVRVTLDGLDDLFKHSARLLKTVQALEGK